MKRRRIHPILFTLFPTVLLLGLSQIVANGKTWRALADPARPQGTEARERSACNRVKFQQAITVKSVSGPVYFRAIDQPMCRLAPGQTISNTGFLLADAHGQVDLVVDAAGPEIRLAPREMLFVEKAL